MFYRTAHDTISGEPPHDDHLKESKKFKFIKRLNENL